MESVYFKYLIYFSVAFIMSLIGTYNYYHTSKLHSKRVALSDFLLTVLSMYVIVDIIGNIYDVGFGGIVSFASGTAFGSFVLLEYEKYKKKKGD